MVIIDAPEFKIRINKVGKYYRIHEILPDCMLPNIQVGDVIVSIGRWIINEYMSLENLEHILQETGHLIKVVKYRTAQTRGNRARDEVQRDHEQVIHDIVYLFLYFKAFLLILFHTIKRYDIGIHLAELAVDICIFSHLNVKKQSVVLMALLILSELDFRNCDLCLQTFVISSKIQLLFPK